MTSEKARNYSTIYDFVGLGYVLFCLILLF